MMENPPALASKEATEEARREAARLMGSIKTEKKARASRANGFKPGNPGSPGRARKRLTEIPCSCGAGEALEGHKWDCMRGQAIKRRTKQGRDLLTGELLSSQGSALGSPSLVESD